MRRCIVWLGFALLSVANSGLSAPMIVSEEASRLTGAPLAKPVVLGIYDAEADAEMTVVTARLSEKPAFESVKLEDHGSFFQVVLPNVVVPHPGQFNDGKGPYAKKIAAYQLSPTDGAIRIFTEGDSKALFAATTAEILNDRLVVTIDHRNLPAALKTGGATDAAAINGVTTESAKSGDLTPADLARAPNTTSVGSNVIDLSSRLNSVAIFSGVMLLGLLGLYFSKSIFRRRRGGADASESFQMKTLSFMPLAPKQRLALIEICNEKILVGVSPGQISYLTTINGTAKRSGQQAIVAEPSVGLPAQIQQYFQKQVPAVNSTVELKASPSTNFSETPELKNVPAKKTSRQATSVAAGELTQSAKEPARRINVAITDEGIEPRQAPLNKRSRAESHSEEPKDIGDVTRIIREKLKNLSQVTPKA